MHSVVIHAEFRFNNVDPECCCTMVANKAEPYSCDQNTTARPVTSVFIHYLTSLI